jgi:hypothetical protein
MNSKTISAALLFAGAIFWLSASAQSIGSTTNDTLPRVAADTIQMSTAQSAPDTTPAPAALSADSTSKLTIIKRHHNYRDQVRYGLSTMAFIAIMITLSQAYNPE